MTSRATFPACFLASATISRAWRGLLALIGAALSLPAQAQITVLSRQPARHAVAVAHTAPVAVGFSQSLPAASAAGLRV